MDAGRSGPLPSGPGFVTVSCHTRHLRGQDGLWVPSAAASVTDGGLGITILMD